MGGIRSACDGGNGTVAAPDRDELSGVPVHVLRASARAVNLLGRASKVRPAGGLQGRQDLAGQSAVAPGLVRDVKDQVEQPGWIGAAFEFNLARRRATDDEDEPAEVDFDAGVLVVGGWIRGHGGSWFRVRFTADSQA